MADFVKKTWVCGDTITADELNRMEDGIEEAVSSSDVGYSCTETTVLLTDESVTTTSNGGIARALLAYSTPIDAETIKVTFNGTEYVCDSYVDGALVYGATSDDFSDYPFALTSTEGANMLITENAGTYQVKIEEMQPSATVSDCFKVAVYSLVGKPFVVEAESLESMGGDSKLLVTNTAWTQLQKAIVAGRPCYLNFIPTEDALCQSNDVGDIPKGRLPIISVWQDGSSTWNLDVANSSSGAVIASLSSVTGDVMGFEADCQSV